MSYLAHLPDGQTVDRRSRRIAMEIAAANRKRAWRKAFVRVVRDELWADEFDRLCRLTDEVVDAGACS